VIAVASNKGGVGKTTVTANLAIYLRALHEELPVAVVGLDDQSILDRMFRLGPEGAPPLTLKHGWAEHSLDRVLRLGQFGIHWVPPPRDTEPLKARAEDPRTLQRILAHTHFSGLVLIDTKGDLEALTRNALVAADLVIIPVADRASLEEAGNVFDGIERLSPASSKGRVLFTLVDRRTRVDAQGRDLHDRLVAEAEERGWPRFVTYLSRSPRVEALNSAGGRPGSVLHQARGTAVHRQLRELAEEVGKLLDLGATPRRPAPPAERAEPHGRSVSLKGFLLRGLSGGRRS